MNALVLVIKEYFNNRKEVRVQAQEMAEYGVSEFTTRQHVEADKIDWDGSKSFAEIFGTDEVLD